MRNMLIILVALVFSWGSSLAEETVIVSGHFERAPFDWQEGERLKGAAIEIIEEIFKDFGIKVEARYVGPWKRVLMNLKQGQIDLMSGLYVTEERKAFAEFTKEPLSEDRVSVFVWHDRPFKFETWEDLKGKRFGEILGATRGKDFDEWRKKHAVLDYVSDHKMNFKKLEMGRIDCFVTSHYLGLMYSRKLGYEGKIVALPNPVKIKYLHYAISKKSPFVKYLPQIDMKLRAFHRDGTIERIIKKNLEYYVSTHLKK